MSFSGFLLSFFLSRWSTGSYSSLSFYICTICHLHRIYTHLTIPTTKIFVSRHFLIWHVHRWYRSFRMLTIVFFLFVSMFTSRSYLTVPFLCEYIDPARVCVRFWSSVIIIHLNGISRLIIFSHLIVIDRPNDRFYDDADNKYKREWVNRFILRCHLWTFQWWETIDLHSMFIRQWEREREKSIQSLCLHDSMLRQHWLPSALLYLKQLNS
jgi:hypothetical protein